MSEQLRIDTTVLSNASFSLGGIAAEFNADNIIADELGVMVGDDDLAGRVRSFATMWELQRAKMLANVEALQKMLQTTIDTFESADATLASDLSSSA